MTGEGRRTLSYCGFVPNGIDDFGPRYEVEKCNSIFDHNKPIIGQKRNPTTWYVWSYRWLIPKTKLFVNATPSFDGHMLKRRQRMLDSFPAIVLYPNSKYTYTYRFKRGFLEHLCYRFASKPVFWKKLGLSLGPTDNLDDCFQLAIVDGGEGGVEDSLLTNWPNSE